MLSMKMLFFNEYNCQEFSEQMKEKRYSNEEAF